MNNSPMDPSTPFAVVVNDDPTQLNVLTGLVHKAGLEPRTFTAAEEALSQMSIYAETVDIDPGALPAVIVTDLYMPGIDGWRFCRLLRSPEYSSFNHVPILVVSATFAGEETDRIAADLGAEAFLSSPVDGQRFIEQVRAIMSGNQVRAPLRVLIVEDSNTQSSIIRKAFASHGYQADTAVTVQAATDAFGKTAYDVAVLDYHLPDGTGDELLDAFRMQRPDCVFIMMTADPRPDLALNWMKRGAAAYLRKPFQTDYLIELCARARRERALLRVKDLLELRTQELRKSEERFLQAQKMETVGRLAGGVAHDFNNMLSVILGHSELAIGQVDPAQQLFADLREIQKAAERAAVLTRQLLAFARKQTVSPKVLDLNEIVEGMLKMLLRLIGEDIHLSWQPAENLWQVKVDPSQIDQILANLCVNARDAISGVGKIIIETGNITLDKDYCAHHDGFVPGEYVQLAVSDDGCGMGNETLAHIFEPFFTTKGVGEGTGLGLATVYGIVKQNNGFINVYSEPDAGTIFTIYLPRNQGEAEQKRKEGPAEAVSRGHETILLVEDDPAILDVTTLILQKQGYSVLAAGTPDKAISLAAEHLDEIHLLITDVIMPEMNGRDLARNLLSINPQLKCLFMSGYTADVIAPHGVLEEGVYFIQKPFSLQLLAAKVREVLDSK